MRMVLGYMAAFCLLLLIVSQSVIIPTFFTPFFRWQYNRNETAAEIGIAHDDLMYVTGELLAYMRGNRDTLHGITAEVTGRGARRLGENFFSPTEIRHMYDVLRLYDILFMVRNIAFFAFIALVLGMILMKENPLYLLSRCAREVLAGFLGLAAIVTLLISFNFARAWDIFHYIFFRGDAANYWRLTPFTDLMINMFPLSFFLHMSVFVGGLLLLFCGVVITAGSLYLKYMSPPVRFGRA